MTVTFFSARRRRRALTLLEVLLTLALLVVLASITWPALDRPFANQRLRKSADVIRVEWARARVRAMSSGEIYLFRYALDGNRYAVEGRAGPEFSADTAEGGEPEGETSLGSSESTLPENITFLSSETTTDTRAETVAAESNNLSDVERGWSEPILFYPDGTTSTARLQLKNQHGRTIELYLRGLTGVVTVGNVKAAQESTP